MDATRITGPAPQFIFALTHTFSPLAHATLRTYLDVPSAADGWLTHGPRTVEPGRNPHSRYDFRALTDGTVPAVELNDLVSMVDVPAGDLVHDKSRADARSAVADAINDTLRAAGW